MLGNGAVELLYLHSYWECVGVGKWSITIVEFMQWHTDMQLQALQLYCYIFGLKVFVAMIH